MYAPHHKLVNKQKLTMWKLSSQHYLQGYRRDGRSYERDALIQNLKKKVIGEAVSETFKVSQSGNYRWIHGYQR